jgi:hypothetical protein
MKYYLVIPRGRKDFNTVIFEAPGAAKEFAVVYLEVWQFVGAVVCAVQARRDGATTAPGTATAPRFRVPGSAVRLLRVPGSRFRR